MKKIVISILGLLYISLLIMIFRSHTVKEERQSKWIRKEGIVVAHGPKEARYKHFHVPLHIEFDYAGRKIRGSPAQIYAPENFPIGKIVEIFSNPESPEQIIINDTETLFGVILISVILPLSIVGYLFWNWRHSKTNE